MKKLILIGCSLILFFLANNITGQNITFQLDGDRLYLSENGDCSGGPDARWRLRARTQYSGYFNWNRDADDISGGWHNYTNFSWINNTSVPNNAVISVDLDAWEEDPATCDNPCFFCTNGGPDDGDCFGYGNIANRNITSYAPCQWHYFEDFRNCTDDGVTINWGVRYSFYYTFDDLAPGTIAGGGNYYNCDNPPSMTNTASATTWSSYQWQQSLNGGSIWTNIVGATAATYDPPSLSATTIYRRRASDCSGRTRYSNAITYTILDNGDPTVFGTNVWNVYGYNGRDRDNLASLDYAGYYIDNNFSVNTALRWNSSLAPSTATGYIGCNVGKDIHTFVHKRQGFPCGLYQLNINNHDDEISVYVDGIQVFLYNGCCVNHGAVWSGYLGSATTVEIRVAEGGGGSVLDMTLTDLTTPLTAGTVNGDQSICSGTNPSILGSTATASGGTVSAVSPTYQWQKSTTNCSTGFANITGANAQTYPPLNPSQTTYYRRSVTDACGDISYTNCVVITINTISTAPIIAAISGKQCPNSSISLSATGGVSGAGATIEWYSGPNGSGSFLGTGANLSVSPSTTTTYYARRTGTCNTTLDDTETVDVRNFSYSPVGVSSSVNYCTDNTGWNHFYNASDDIILSVEGDLTGASTTPVAKITNNGSFYQATVGAVGSCNSGLNPGEEFFELPRSWNVEFNGTLNPPYAVRYYFPAAEQTTLINAANNHIASNLNCMYSYKYITPNGFYWFKNIGSDYVAPTFDEPTQLTGTNNTVNGTHYAEINGISSFSGGSGAIALSPDPSLPVEYLSFEGINVGNANYLNWLTASETNSLFFEIEKMQENQNSFLKIGQVEAAGTVVSLQNYQFVDQNPSSGINYYRLNQIDQDGSNSYSAIVAIENGKPTDLVSIFPNPTKSTVNYQCQSFVAANIQVSISNVLGKRLSNTSYVLEKGMNTLEFDLSNYPTGMYHISITNQQSLVRKTYKVIKADR
jgi:hypothetical protein